MTHSNTLLSTGLKSFALKFSRLQWRSRLRVSLRGYESERLIRSSALAAAHEFVVGICAVCLTTLAVWSHDPDTTRSSVRVWLQSTAYTWTHTHSGSPQRRCPAVHYLPMFHWLTVKRIGRYQKVPIRISIISYIINMHGKQTTRSSSHALGRSQEFKSVAVETILLWFLLILG